MSLTLIENAPIRRADARTGLNVGAGTDDQSFDAAMAVCTVHHWQDPTAGMRDDLASGRWADATVTSSVSTRPSSALACLSPDSGRPRAAVIRMPEPARRR